MTTEVVKVTTESKGDIVINCVAIFYEEGKEGENFRKKITNFFVIVELHIHPVSVFRKKSDAVCGFLAYLCAALRFSNNPGTP